MKIKFQVARKPEGLVPDRKRTHWTELCEAFEKLKNEETIRISLSQNAKDDDIKTLKQNVRNALHQRKLGCQFAVVGDVLHVFRVQREN